MLAFNTTMNKLIWTLISEAYYSLMLKFTQLWSLMHPVIVAQIGLQNTQMIISLHAW